jgi:hypothetical protein
MKVASFIREYLLNAKDENGHNRFQILDGGDTCCLPVVAARLDPSSHRPYDDVDLQHLLSESHWYVSGYGLGFEDPFDGSAFKPLCGDASSDATMFRIVVKSNLTMSLAENLIATFEATLPILDSMEAGFLSANTAKLALRHLIKPSLNAQALVVTAAKKWLKIREHKGNSRLRRCSTNSAAC